MSAEEIRRELAHEAATAERVRLIRDSRARDRRRTIERRAARAAKYGSAR